MEDPPMSLALKVQTPQQRCSDTPVPDRDVRILRNNNKVQFFVKKKSSVGSLIQSK